MIKFKTRAKTSDGIAEAFAEAARKADYGPLARKRSFVLAAYDMFRAGHVEMAYAGKIDTDIFDTALFAISESMDKADAGIFIDVLGRPSEVSAETLTYGGGLAMEAASIFTMTDYSNRRREDVAGRLLAALMHYALSVTARYFDNVRKFGGDGGVASNSAWAADAYANLHAHLYGGLDAAHARAINLFKAALERSI